MTGKQNIQASPHQPGGTVAQQPPWRIINNPPASTPAQALANAQRQVEQAMQK